MPQEEKEPVVEKVKMKQRVLNKGAAINEKFG